MVSLSDIHHARKMISEVIKSTPILTSKALSIEGGNEIFLKCEHLQKTVSFKIRGATSKVKNIQDQEFKHIVAASSGNHGQAVAYIASHLGLESTIVVPEDISLCKQEAIKSYGGNIEYCGTTSNDRLSRAEQHCEFSKGVFIPPYDDPAIIAGQGTVGLEILEQLDDIDVIYAPIGGGGLISGVATAIKESNPSIKVVGVEPETANDTYLSVQQQSRVKISSSNTVADGLRTLIPGEMTFPIIRRYVDEVILVSEEQIKFAFSFVLTRMKQLIEPSGAVSVAAALFSSEKDKKSVAVVSGGNVNPEFIPQMLSETTVTNDN